MLSVDQVVDRYGGTIANLGYGRRQLATWLNDNLPGEYTEYFARQVLYEVEVRFGLEKSSINEPISHNLNQPASETVEERLRELYSIQDPSWVPVSIWGEPGAPRAKWERRGPSVDLDKAHAVLGKHFANSPILTDFDDRDLDIDLLGVISIRDAHFGLFTEHPGPYATYNLEDAQDAYVSAFDELFERAIKSGVRTLVYPIGSDMLHVDNPQNTTTKGTPQDVSAQWWEAFTAAVSSINWCVNRAVGELGEGNVIVVLENGNHDHHLSRLLGLTIQQRWEGVTVLTSADSIKRFTFGRTHLFFHHGDGIKPENYPGIIATDHPEVVGKGDYVEVLSGHLHHRRRSVLGASGDYLEAGAIVHRITPALCPSSNWSEASGYRSSPGAQLTLYDMDGFIGMFEWSPRRMA